MQFLFNISVANNLLHSNTDRTFGDVEDNTGLAMIVFERQTLLLS